MVVFLNGFHPKPKRGAKLLRSCLLSVCSLNANLMLGNDASIAFTPVGCALVGSKKPGLGSSGFVSSEGSKLAKRPFFSVGHPNQSQRKPNVRVRSPNLHSSVA